MVTLKDVAREAGVSPATVSYALRGGKYVSQETMDSVEAAIVKLGYSVNQTARNLRRGRTGILGVGVHEFDEPWFYSRLAEALVNRIEAAGYRALVVKTGTSAGSVQETVSQMADQPCDGLIAPAGYLPSADLKRLSLNKPVVLIDDYSQDLVLDTVIINGYEGIRMVTRHLIAQGCRRLAMVGCSYTPEGQLTDTEKGPSRTLGFVEALHEAGLAYTPEQMYDVESWTVDPGREAAERILKDGLRFDGIVCATDSLALGLIRGFADKGISLPTAVRIAGFDGITPGEYAVPSLTTVAADMDDLAEKAVSMLIDRVEKQYDGEPRRAETKLRLIERESSK